MSRSEEERKELRMEFRDSVNMSPSEIEDWLETEESKSVGQDSGDGESIGRKSARKIIDIRRQNVEDHTDSDYDHMQKVVGYIARHLAQRPDGSIEETDWRYSLMNWGHDPLED